MILHILLELIGAGTVALTLLAYFLQWRDRAFPKDGGGE